MARVTVEDCLKNVKNRFELVMIASKRARQLMRGKEPKVPWDNDKSTVVALREIAAGFTDFDHPEEEHKPELTLEPEPEKKTEPEPEKKEPLAASNDPAVQSDKE